MCLATPVKIKKVNNNCALLDDGRKVDLSLIGNAQIGNWILCHDSLAINKLDEKEAKEILELAKKCHHQ